MSKARVFVTGAFGNVGENTVSQLCTQGYNVVCFDIQTKATEKIKAALEKNHQFETIWGNLIDHQSVQQAVISSEPEVIIHIAAIIAPIAYVQPELAYRVNVDGSAYLMNAAQALPKPPKFINVSSYSVHGPQNPFKDLPFLTGLSPVNPRDNYGAQKVIIEKMLAQSGLPFTTIRLPMVMATNRAWGQHPAFLTFGFSLCLDRKQHGIDSRDAARALVNAIEADTNGMTFNVAGPDDCRVIYREFTNLITKVRGISPFDESAYRVASPNVDEAWYFENFVDTTRSQKILNYQQHNLQDHLDYIAHRDRFLTPIVKVIGPLVKRRLQKLSTTIHLEPKVDTRSLWQVVCDRFNLDPAELYRNETDIAIFEDKPLGETQLKRKVSA